MVETVMFTYGMLASFVLAGASRNRRLQRRNPRALEYFGYVLLGCSSALSIALFAFAAYNFIAG